MRGHLVKRSKGSWSIVLDAQPGADGKRQRQWITVKGTKRDAEAKLAELVHQLDSGLPIDRGKITVAEYLSTWLRDVVAVRNRPRTLASYRTIVTHHVVPVLGKIPLVKLQPSDVERAEALVRANRSASTAHHVHVILSKALKDALRKRLISRNVCLLVEPPKAETYEVHPPEMDAIKAILEQTDRTPYGVCYRFVAYTGIRRGEAVALRWRNIDLEHGVCSIVEEAQRLTGRGIVFLPPKSKAGRRGIALDAATVDLLRQHRGAQLLHSVELEGGYEDNDLVFPGLLGKPVDPSVLTRNFEKATKKAGCPGVRLHDLRHFHASGLIRANVHPRVVQERLGHASAAFTMQVYGHVAAGLQAEAAEAFSKLMQGQSERVG